MFIEKRHSTPSLVPPNAISAFGVDLVGTICLSFYAVPTELKRGDVITSFYKHCVPTGLKRTKVSTSVQTLYTPESIGCVKCL